jgi:sodium/potassium-transporting ATPase subunit alpha
LFEKLHSSQENGLTSEKAKELFQQLGENALSEKIGTPWYCMLLKEFTTFFALLLWGGGILCFIGYGVDPSSLDNVFLALVLWSVVILTGTFSYLQSSKTASLMADF